MNNRFIILLLLAFTVSISEPSLLVISVHAAGFTGTGLVCIITNTTATNCPSKAPTIGPLTTGSIFTVGVYVNNSQPMGGYDIYVSANPSYLSPSSVALGHLIASPSLTNICVNGSAQNGTCTVGTANGPGIIEASTVENSGINECGGIAPCSGLAFTITYRVVGSTPGTSLSYPTAAGCSTSSVASPPNTCVLVVSSVGVALPETVQAAVVTTPAVVCITSPSTSTACSIGPAKIAVTVGSSFTVGVRVENSQPLAGFDIYVAVNSLYLNPTNLALGPLIATPSLTTRCLNGQTIEGACAIAAANGPGVVEASTVESFGGNECVTAPCSGLAFNITYQVTGATPSTSFWFPSAPGCSVSSVSSPANVCVLVANSTGAVLPENVQGATVTQSVTTGHSTSMTVGCGSPVVVGQLTTCTASVTDTSTSGTIFPLGTVAWSTDAVGSFIINACTLFPPIGPNTNTCSVQYRPTLVGSGGPAGTGITHVTAVYSGDTIHLGSTGQATITILRATPIVAAFVIVDQTGLPVPSTGIPQNIPVHGALLMIGGYPVTGAPGTVTYTLYPNSACSPGTGTMVITVLVGPSNNVPTSTSVTPAAGSNSLNTFYLGDGNNYNVTSACEPFTVTPAPSFAHLHWTHHLSLSKSSNMQGWTVTVANPLSTSVKIVVRITGSSTINPSLTFDVTCGVTCVSTGASVNFTPGLTPVTIAAGATSSTFSFNQPISSSFVGQKVTFTTTLYWATGALYTSSGSSSGSFAVVA